MTLSTLIRRLSAERTHFSRVCKAVPVFHALLLRTFLRQRRQPVVIWSKLLRRRVWIRPRSSDWPVFLKVLGSREYEFEQELPPKPFIIDAGANIGLSALYFAWRYPDAEIFAIEPEGSNLELLRRNCSELGCVRVAPAALWSRRTMLSIVDPDSEKWTFSVSEEAAGCHQVQTITIPEIMRQTGRDQIDILKLDIEGAEKALFSDGWRDWLPKVRVIVIELHDRFVPGCSQSFYSAILSRPFAQEVNGENVIIRFNPKV